MLLNFQKMLPFRLQLQIYFNIIHKIGVQVVDFKIEFLIIFNKIITLILFVSNHFVTSCNRIS